MRKSKALRVGGFVGALATSAALVGFAASGTGAYFTDAHNGAINASTGHVKLDVSPADGQLNFTNLLPGEYQTQQINYTAHGTGAEDVWLVFPTTASDGSNPSEAFTGSGGDAAGGGLGRYGHFAVTSNAGDFTSYNLQNPGTTFPHTGSSCSIDANGHGGSDQQAASRTDPTLIPFCAPANAILLDSNLPDGAGGTATLTFGYTPLLRSGQDAPNAKVVSYQIVATQHGIRPDDPNN